MKTLIEEKYDDEYESSDEENDQEASLLYLQNNDSEKNEVDDEQTSRLKKS